MIKRLCSGAVVAHGRWFTVKEDTSLITDLNMHRRCYPVFGATMIAVFNYFQSIAKKS